MEDYLAAYKTQEDLKPYFRLLHDFYKVAYNRNEETISDIPRVFPKLQSSEISSFLKEVEQFLSYQYQLRVKALYECLGTSEERDRAIECLRSLS
jgi:hypothetical protein